MEDVDILFVHLVHFMAIRYIWWPFDTYNGYLVHFSCFSILYQEKSGNPA
jgi:hypothetical protein